MMQKENSISLLEAFQPGDLLYGMSRIRKLIQSDLTKRLDVLKAKHNYVTIDELVKPLEPHIFYNNNYDATPIKRLITPVKEHAYALTSDPNFHPDPVVCPDSDQKERHKFLVSCLTAIRNCEGKIHFCLDDLKLDQLRDPQSKRYHHYTSHELRFIANNFASLRDKIIFYRNFQQVPPPWEADNQEADEWLISYSQKSKNAPAPRIQAIARKIAFAGNIGSPLQEDNTKRQKIDMSP